MNGRFIPTLLSASRIAFAPFVVAAILDRDHSRALALLMVAGSTDFFDGYLARRYDWKTRAGAWTDAVADKGLLSAVFISLAISGAAPAWLVYLIFGRDLLILLMAVIGLLFTPIRDFPPSLWGKLSTNVQIMTALACLLPFEAARTVLIYVCTATTPFSGGHYFYSALKRLRGLRRAAN